MALFFWDANGDQPVSAASLLNGHLGSADDLADLKGYDTTGLPNGVKAFLPDVGIYKFDNSSTATGDDFRVIDPTTGPGRWLLQIFGPEWVQDTNWITTFPSADGNNYQYLGTDGAGVISFQSPANGPVLFTQASHGFVAKDMIRHNGTSWVKAQGDTIVKCTGTWLVVAVDGNDFIAVKSGRVTVSGHGLTAGSLYYLSAASAGALTTTKPVGDTTTPLGFFLPAVYVESSSVLHILGQQYPTINRTLAEYINTSGANISDIDFTNLSLLSYGGSVGFEFSALTTANSGEFYATAQINNSWSIYYDYKFIYDNGSATQRHASVSQSNGLIVYGASNSIGLTVSANGAIKMCGRNGSNIGVSSNCAYESPLASGNGYCQYNFGVSDITRIRFTFSYLALNFPLRQSIRLLWDGPAS